MAARRRRLLIATKNDDNQPKMTLIVLPPRHAFRIPKRVWRGMTAAAILASFTACSGGGAPTSALSPTSTAPPVIAPTPSPTLAPTPAAPSAIVPTPPTPTALAPKRDANPELRSNEPESPPVIVPTPFPTLAPTPTAPPAVVPTPPTPTALAPSATPGLGLRLNEPESFEGYTLFSARSAGYTYLINNRGNVVQAWPSQTNMTRLLNNGNALSSGVTESDRDGNVVWRFRFPNIMIS